MPTYTSSAVSTFIAQLRLLDLDQLEDWPVLSAELFEPKHARKYQKQRIGCVEWALYRLFDLWNPKETKHKLQPFFPPYESLRSLNLRAALFRSLSELKKIGLLGKEVVIRKTMFDDCRGDRFEELLVSFSTIVLQKVYRAKSNCTTSIAGRLATRHNIPRKEHGSLIPLAIAHQGALRGLLGRKERLKERYANLQILLEAKEQELLNRVDELAQADTQHPLEAVSDRVVEEIQHQFDKNWLGDTQWVKCIIEADTRDSVDPLLKTSFPSVWSLVENGTIHDIEGNAEQSLVQDLTRRVHVQQERLLRWQTVQQKLIGSRPRSPSKIDGKTTPYRNGAFVSPLKFEYWEHYKTGDDNINGPISPEMKMHHRQLLEYNQRQSKSVTTPSNELGSKLPLGCWVVPIATKSENHSQAELAPLSSQTGSIPSRLLTPFEMEAEVDRDAGTSLGSTILQQKTDFIEFPGDLCSRVDTDLEHAISNLGFAGNGLPTTRVRDDAAATEYEASSIPRHGNHHKFGYMNVNQLSHSPWFSSSLAVNVRASTQGSTVAQHISAANMVSEASLVKHEASLMERARQSMFPFQADMLLSESLMDPTPSQTRGSIHSYERQFTDLGRSSSLVERTRRSMSLVPGPFPIKDSRTSIQNRRHPKKYPTNQFKTPEKQLGDLEEDTPPDVLFSPEADYASVFKSRPKIATSPKLSPALHGMMQWHESVKDEDFGLA
ncbi:MAG: hypothetical protein Q9213_003230 [Squamulea squamosa]